jgi:hypothetical protein
MKIVTSMWKMARVAVILSLVPSSSCALWGQVQAMKTSACLASAARALSKGGEALEGLSAAGGQEEWFALDRERGRRVFSTVRESIGDCPAWASDGALLDWWRQPVVLEVGRPTAEGGFPFRVRSGGYDQLIQTDDDLLVPAVWSRPAARK